MNNFMLTRMKDYLHYNLAKPYKRGMGIKDPLILDFVDNVLCTTYNPVIEKVKNIQGEYFRDRTIIEIEDFGAGSRNSQSKYRKISEIARNATSSPRKCKLLFNLVAHYKPDVVIELGTSMGIGTLSLAFANKESTIYTLEGSPELYKLATGLFKMQDAANIRPILGKFDEKFPALLKQLASADLFFIDGNHTHEATLRYFDMACKYSKPSSILVFDDIRWSEGMYNAWLEICGKPETKLTIDLLDIGIVFLSDKIMKQNLRIYY